MFSALRCLAFLLTLGCALAWPGQLSWQNVSVITPGPTNIGAFAFTSLESANRLYVFGGVHEDFPNAVNTWSDDLYTFDVGTRQWTLLDSGSGPTARGLLGGVTDPVRQQLLIFGGINYTAQFFPITFFDDLWSWDYVNGGWLQLTSFPGPGFLADMGMIYHDNAVYVFGGINQQFQDTNALWRYDIASDGWSLLSVDGDPTAPSKRHNVRMAVLDNRLYINAGSFSGADIEQDDSWSYDLITGTWSDITPNDNHNIDPGRTFPAHDAIGDMWLIYGGEIPGGEANCGSPFPQNVIGDTWLGQIKKNNKLKWKQVFPSLSPPPLKRAGATDLGGKFYLFGGYNWVCPGGVGPGGVYNNALWTLVGL